MLNARHNVRLRARSQGWGFNSVRETLEVMAESKCSLQAQPPNIFTESVILFIVSPYRNRVSESNVAINFHILTTVLAAFGVFSNILINVKRSFCWSIKQDHDSDIFDSSSFQRD